MTYVLGIDSSTQSCKALLVDAVTGEIVDSGRASHPDGTQVDPQAWLTAMEEATAGLIDRADAVAVGGQQHGMVPLDANGEVVRPAMLWNDTSSASEAEELIDELGGEQACADTVGSVLVASLTGTKLRWLRNHEPENARKTSSVLLPHDYLTWHLGGRKEKTTDHGDASGTGYYSTRDRKSLPNLAEQYIGHAIELPRVAEPNEVVGKTNGEALIAPGTGDNMAAALGLNLRPGDVCVSIGTSGVVSAVSKESVHDPSGLVTGFADATGNYLPLACTLNGAKVLDFAAMLLGVDHEGLSQLALGGKPGAGGVTMLPYFDGERTPNRPDATGHFAGLTTRTTREDIARAVVEGILCSLQDAISAVEAATGNRAQRVLLTGGGARSEAMRRIAPEIFGVDVIVPEPAEYVALGAARQAAWALNGGGSLPEWGLAKEQTFSGKPTPETVDKYQRLRDLTVNY
ncbi:xylulokinase [Corynebacterium accolens]|uniref:xylulokinase n=1 Tax=Corynebacterium accolens TaxID=38284 RepID=UPI002551ACCD|nr:xylulokinase [Corynebacterium accolens]MDK8468689.1 xylulokinase [Corynebacterium accolens]MDK8497425.1 xylulokinase [Corynebacterium accolens]MDK8674223.1 xylulokinase [Corynebacterium accolens]